MAKHEKKPQNKIIKVLIIIKNIVFVTLFVLLVSVISVTLTARINGQTPSMFGHTVYRVSSGSMVPYLEIGDIILCSDVDPMTLKEGDVITYDGKSGQFAGKRVTHRVVRAPYYNDGDGQFYLITKGDDNPVEDTPITVSQVTGKMVGKLGFLNMIYSFFVTPWGLLTLIGLIIIAFFNEIIIFVKALFGIADEEKPEDIQDIIERVQREGLEEKQKKAETKKEE